MKLTMRLTTWLIVGVVAGLLVACGGAGSVGGAPTQTPVYVVITDTPHPDDSGVGPAESGVGQDDSGDEGGNGGSAAPAGDSSDSDLVAVPTPFLCKAEVVEQTYEGGYMFWVGGTVSERCKTEHDFDPGSGEIWVAILGDGRDDWLVFTDDWEEGVDPEKDEGLEVPEGLLQPIRGFGKVWRERLDDEDREDLGWATAPEFKFVTDYRYDPGGFLNDAGEYVPRPGVHRLVALGGEQFFFDEASETVFYIEPED